MKFKDYYNETLQGAIDQLLIEFTVKDFRTFVPSERNKLWLKKRRDTGNIGSFLKDVIWNDKKNTLLLKFTSIPTPTLPIKKISKTGNSSNARQYKIEIQFENVSNYLGTKSEFISLTKGTQIKRVREMNKLATVRVHSDDPSYLWQSSWYTATENDFNIYKMPSKNSIDTGIWKSRHENKKEFINKHILEVIQNISFIPDEVAKLIRDKYI